MKGRRERVNIMEFIVAFFNWESSPQFQKTAGKWAHTHTSLTLLGMFLLTQQILLLHFLAMLARMWGVTASVSKPIPGLFVQHAPPPPEVSFMKYSLDPLLPTEEKAGLGEREAEAAWILNFWTPAEEWFYRPLRECFMNLACFCLWLLWESHHRLSIKYES